MPRIGPPSWHLREVLRGVGPARRDSSPRREGLRREHRCSLHWRRSPRPRTLGAWLSSVNLTDNYIHRRWALTNSLRMRRINGPHAQGAARRTFSVLFHINSHNIYRSKIFRCYISPLVQPRLSEEGCLVQRTECKAFLQMTDAV